MLVQIAPLLSLAPRGLSYARSRPLSEIGEIEAVPQVVPREVRTLDA